MKSLSLKNIVKNLYFLSAYDLRKEVDSMKDEYQAKFYEYSLFNLLQKILMYYTVNREDASLYKEELSYMQQIGNVKIFPYPQIRTIEHEIESGINNQLPYVKHNGKLLYFPKTWDVEQAKWTYKNFIERENTLGGGYTSKAPHQYQTENFKVEGGDVLVDVGCAEALLSLDVVEKVSKVYLIEANPIWIEALQATFDPWKEKVEIVNKLVTDSDSAETRTLSSILKNENGKSFFVKMGIEGYELSVLQGSKDFFTNEKHVKLACCTYHRVNDAKDISEFLSPLEYTYSFSEGYMIYPLDKNLSAPYFRHGVIRAKNY